MIYSMILQHSSFEGFFSYATYRTPARQTHPSCLRRSGHPLFRSKPGGDRDFAWEEGEKWGKNTQNPMVNHHFPHGHGHNLRVWPILKHAHMLLKYQRWGLETQKPMGIQEFDNASFSSWMLMDVETMKFLICLTVLYKIGVPPYHHPFLGFSMK